MLEQDAALFPHATGWQTRETAASIFQTGSGRGTYQMYHCETFGYSGFCAKERMNEEIKKSEEEFWPRVLRTVTIRNEHGKGRGRRWVMLEASSALTPALPREREEHLTPSNRAPSLARLLRSLFPVSHLADGGHRCWDRREKGKKQTDGESARAAAPSPGGEGRGEGGGCPPPLAECRKMGNSPESFRGRPPARKTSVFNPCLIRG